MFEACVLALAAIALPVGLAASLVTHDLIRLVELTAVGTVACLLVVVATWRWARKKEVAAQEAATPWLHVPSSIAGGINAWHVLQGEVTPEAAVANRVAEPQEASTGITPAPQ